MKHKYDWCVIYMWIFDIPYVKLEIYLTLNLKKGEENRNQIFWFSCRGSVKILEANFRHITGYVTETKCPEYLPNNTDWVVNESSFVTSLIRNKNSAHSKSFLEIYEGLLRTVRKVSNSHVDRSICLADRLGFFVNRRRLRNDTVADGWQRACCVVSRRSIDAW